MVLDSIQKSDPGTNIFVINNAYGWASLTEKLYKSINYSSPIYVLSNKYYGEVTEYKMKIFLKEFCDTCTSDFNGGILVFDKNSKLKVTQEI